MRRITTTQKKSILILDKGDDISELKNPADIIIAPAELLDDSNFILNYYPAIYDSFTNIMFY